MFFALSAALYPHPLFQKHYGKSISIEVEEMSITLKLRVHQSGMVFDQTDHTDLSVELDLKSLSIAQMQLDLRYVKFSGDQGLAIQLKSWLKHYPNITSIIAAHLLPSELYTLSSSSSKAMHHLSKQSLTYLKRCFQYQVCHEWGAAVNHEENQLNTELSALLMQIQMLKQQYLKPCTNEPKDSY
ncbi:hypothetical protein OAT84_01430 [Gammaproteobacteria bacterium]|nr:hypothetical protein [Gammaproteobacteria bacterium]